MIGKRLALSLLAVGVTSLVVTAASFALFSAQTANNNNTFSAGTVTLGNVANCGNTINNIAPGDSGNFTCSVQYTGSLNAWVGYTATMGGDLTTCDGGGRFTAPGLNTGAVPAVIGTEAAPGDSRSVTVNWAFALAAGNDCQGDSGNIGLTFYAVQARNNTNGTNTGPNAWQ
ncbi:MAG: spore coat protein [Symbiobacteriaceae bacterium]|jgi:predicted ribosomally synthesized peptide with SipW-like signal peptide|nr:spore coat protein [Symbiobacteriaceae bacterium]